MHTQTSHIHDAPPAEPPAIFTIFGITGDLAAKKIIPALWHLMREGRLPKRLSVVGFARRPLSDEEFEAMIHKAIEKTSPSSLTDEAFAAFFAMFTYQSGTFETKEGFAPLVTHIEEMESVWGMCSNKLFYLAVPAAAFEPIFERLAENGLNHPCAPGLGWNRILIEKPFGHDAASARELDAQLARFFTEDQVYRIDHYLFKEIIQGIENFRFSNNLFERTWDRDSIERIDIRLHETLGAEGRGPFYESVGALRDVGQNHVLAMLAAITMEYPISTDVAAIRKNRTDILSTLAAWTEESLKSGTYRAQYDGYRSIEGVDPQSDVETYFALKTELTHPRWAGIPIFLESGKRLGESRKEIILTLKHPPACLLCEEGRHGPNRIAFRLEPNDEIIIDFWTRKPGLEHELEERTMSFFLYEKKNKVQYVEEYAKVLHAAIAGEQSFFSSSEEVQALWKFVDPVVAAWQRGVVPLDTYAPGTTPAPAFAAEEADMHHNTAKGAFGLIGLGKMGAGIVRQAHEKHWNAIGFNRSPEAAERLASEGIPVAFTVEDLIAKLPAPRTLWLMVPHQSVDTVLEELMPLLSPGDTIIEGGNSPYLDSIRRHAAAKEKGIGFLDAGVSGGPSGARNGACIMIGGERELYEKYEPLFKDLSVPQGYLYAGRAGAGHFVKMVHNGIEYGMMQAIAEGFEIIKRSSLDIDVGPVAELYDHGSVIESHLIRWLADAYKKAGPELAQYSGSVAASGEGQWTVDEAKRLGVPAPIIEGALDFRTRSQQSPSYAGRVLSALRNQFGGHDTRDKS